MADRQIGGAVMETAASVLDRLCREVAGVAAFYGASPAELRTSPAAFALLLGRMVTDLELLRSEADRMAAVSNLVNQPESEPCLNGS